MRPAATGRGIARRPVAGPSSAPATRAGAAAVSLDALYRVNLIALWKYLVSQPLSFWFINLYLLFEYVRPQSIYTFLEGPPWAMMTVLLAMGALVMEGKFFSMKTPVDAAMAVFTGIIVISSTQAYYPALSYSRLSEWIAWVLIYLLIANIVTTEKRFFVFMFAFLLYSFKMSQHSTRSWASVGFAFRDWGTTGAPGWFENSGEFGIQMTIFIPLVCYFVAALRNQWSLPVKLLFYVMIVTAITGTIGSSSRGAMIGAACVGFFILMKTQHKLKGIGILSVCALFAFFLVPPETIERFQGLGTDDTSMSRRYYWTAGIAAMKEHPLFGVGYYNWTPVLRMEHPGIGLPHNIFVQAGAELGYPGLLGLIGLLAAHFVVNARTRKLAKTLGPRGSFLVAMGHGLDAALVGYIVSGSFVTVLYYPYLWINLAMTVALHNATLNEVAMARTAGAVLPRGAAARQTGARRDTPVTAPPSPGRRPAGGRGRLSAPPFRPGVGFRPRPFPGPPPNLPPDPSPA